MRQIAGHPPSPYADRVRADGDIPGFGGDRASIGVETRASDLASESRIAGTTPAPFGRESRAEKVDSRASRRCKFGGYRLIS